MPRSIKINEAWSYERFLKENKMKKYLTYNPLDQTPKVLIVTFGEKDLPLSNVVLGDMIMDVDGFYYFWPKVDGCWPDYVLLEIGQKLYDLNKEARENLK